jgi:hypothetical protein
MASADQVSLNAAPAEDSSMDFTKSDLIPNHFIQ